jgi:hypothetical protein
VIPQDSGRENTNRKVSLQLFLGREFHFSLRAHHAKGREEEGMRKQVEGIGNVHPYLVLIW